MVTYEGSVDRMFKKVLKFVPDGICPYCGCDVLKGIIVNETTSPITGCPNIKCKRSFVD